MALNPQDDEADTRPVGPGLRPHNPLTSEAIPWMPQFEWGPAHMLNDMGPATVTLTAEDLEREATALTVQHAVERAIEKGEEYEYDE